MNRFPIAHAIGLAAAITCSAALALPFDAGLGPVESPPDTVGPNPKIGPVEKSLIATVRIAPARGWPEGIKPTAAGGVSVGAFAIGLNHPRWLYVLPNGDVLVAETNEPPKPDDAKGVKGKVMKKVQARAGAGAPTANRIVLLRDADGDGVAETKTVFIDKLNSPFGMALVGSTLFVADSDAILKFPYNGGETSITSPGVKLTDLPAGRINHHWTKNIVASADGTKLYATTGSNSNAAENGIAAEEGRAAIYEVDIASGEKHLFATGLRNPNGMAWEPGTGALWTVANERDELGNDLVPDYLTSVRKDAFYGWPYSYYGQHVDVRVKPPRPDMVAKAIAPDYALGAHVAALGLAAAGSTGLPAPFANGMFIGEHGSWNRNPPVGYKVVFVPFAEGKPSGQPVDVLTGFVNPKGEAYGRPVGVALDRNGALLVADDVGNVIWRASGATRSTASR
jgi:glucose/arabinose dehydrogenase